MLTWNDLAIYAASLYGEHKGSQVRICVYGSWLDVDLRECDDPDDFIMADGTPYLEALE
jgi:hypothetical protein